MPRHPTGPRRARGALLAALMLTVTALGGCSSDQDPADPAEPAGRSDGGAEQSVSGPPPLATTVRLGEVVGRVPVPVRRKALRRARDVVDGWIDRAYVAGEWPRSDFPGAFRGFTPGAKAQARRDLRLMTNAGIGSRIESVRATRRRVTFDVLSVRKRPVGLTARVRLAYRTTGKVERTVAVRGRVFLTRTRDGWRVFGYDLAKGAR